MIFTGTILWLVALVAALLWIPQNATHEGAHALVAKFYGGSITKILFYPNDKDGKFSFTPWAAGHAWARVWWEGGEYTAHQRGYVSLAPVATNTILVTLLIVARLVFPDMPPWLASILAAWALTNFADGAFNLGTFYRSEIKSSTDGWGFQARLGLSPLVCRIGAVVWHLGFGSVLLLPMLW